VLATALTLGGAVAVIAVVMTRDGGHAAAHDPGIAPPAVPDAAQAVIPPAPADAAVAVAVMPDAAIPDAALTSRSMRRRRSRSTPRSMRPASGRTARIHPPYRTPAPAAARLHPVAIARSTPTAMGFQTSVNVR